MRDDRGQPASADEMHAQLRASGAQPREQTVMPQLSQPMRPDAPVWHPFRDSMAVSSQAEKVLSALRMVESRQISAPGWHPFWHMVGALDSQEDLCPEVERLVRSAGYYGAMMAGPLSSSLKTCSAADGGGRFSSAWDRADKEWFTGSRPSSCYW